MVAQAGADLSAIALSMALHRLAMSEAVHEVATRDAGSNGGDMSTTSAGIR